MSSWHYCCYRRCYWSGRSVIVINARSRWWYPGDNPLVNRPYEAILFVQLSRRSFLYRVCSTFGKTITWSCEGNMLKGIGVYSDVNIGWVLAFPMSQWPLSSQMCSWSTHCTINGLVIGNLCNVTIESVVSAQLMKIAINSSCLLEKGKH